MKVAILLAFTCAIMTAKLVKGAAIKAPLKIISLKDITPLERETLRFLDQQYKQEREKRSGSEDLFTQLKHKLAAGVKAKSYDHKSFDYLSLKKSILNTLLQAVKAIKGGIIALKGQIVKGSGFLLSAKGKLLSAKGESITHLGKNIASSALLSPHSHSGHDDHHHNHEHYGPPLIYGAPSSPGAHFIHPSGHEHVHHDLHAGKLPLSGVLILKKIPHGVRDIDSHYSHHAAVETKIPHFKPIQHSGPGIGEILVKFLKASSSLKPGDPAPFTDEDFHPKHHHDEHLHAGHLHDSHLHDEHHHHHIDYPPFPDGHHPVQHVHNLDEILAFYKPLISTHEHHIHHDDERDPRHHDVHHHLPDDDHHYHDDVDEHAHHDIDHEHHHHDIDHTHHDIDHSHHNIDHEHHDGHHEHHEDHHSDQLANLDVLEQYYAALTAQKNHQGPVETHEHHYHEESSDGKPKPPGTSYGTPFEDPPGYLNYDELSSPSKKYPKAVPPSSKRTRKRVPQIYHMKPPKSYHHKPHQIHMHPRPHHSRPYSKKKLPTSYDTPISSVQNVQLTSSANMQEPQTYDDLASRFNFPVKPVSSAPTQNNEEVNYQVESGAKSNTVSSVASNYQPSLSSPSSLSLTSPSSFSPPSRGNFPNQPTALRLNMHHHRKPSPFETIPSIAYQLGPNGPMRI